MKEGIFIYPEILGIGHCCQDNICIIEDYPKEDSSTHILNIDDTQGGGAVATALVAAAKLGTGAGIIANIGSDEIGEKILEGFHRSGVCTDLVSRIQDGRSSSSFVMVNSKNGSRTKFPYRDDLPDIQFGGEIKEGFSHAKILHLDGTQYSNAIRGAKLAKEMGLTVSLDACSVQKDNRKNIELASLVDILITNAKYPCRVTGETDIGKALFKLSALGPSIVVATAGNDGCYWVNGSEIIHFPVYPVKVVDSTGAGDTFHGAFLSQWLRDKNIANCLQFATAVSTLKCQKYGGRAGIPTRGETEEFIGKLPSLKGEVAL